MLNNKIILIFSFYYWLIVRHQKIKINEAPDQTSK